MKKKKQRYIIPLSILAVIIFIGLFSLSTGREIVVKPVWYRDLKTVKITKSNKLQQGNKYIWYRNGRLFGYTDLQGNIYLRETSSFFTSLTDRIFIDYSKVAENFFLKDPKGNLISGFHAFGYPFFDKTGQRLFVIKTDLSGISEITETGDATWEQDFNSVITSVSVSSGEISVGLLDGSFKIINDKGRIVFAIKPSGSSIQVITGSAASKDGDMFACISGLNPQKILIFKRHNSNYSVIYSKELRSDFRREVLMRFFPGGRFLLFEAKGGIGIIDINTETLRFVRVNGKIREFSILKEEGLIVIASSSRNRSFFELLKPMDSIFLYTEIKGKIGALRRVENHIILGVGDGIMRIDIEEI